jgi:hypothetical protein
MTARRATTRYLRILILGFIVLVIVAVCAFFRPLHDFVEYWTAAHLLVTHNNPYSLGEVFRMEQSLGFKEPVPLMLLSPPMTLTLIAPLGLASSYALAWLIWVAALVGVVALSSKMLMDVYFGDLRLPEISNNAFYRCLFAFTFFPVLLCLRFTQTAPLILLGLAGFLYFESKRRSMAAGALLSLTLVKPHLVYLVWLALLLWSWQKRTWKVLTAAISVMTLLTGIAMLLDHHIIRQYLDLMRSPYIQAYAAGIASLVRKMTEGIGTLWIQFVPTALGLIWFTIYWRQNRKNWSWIEQMPMLLTMSVFTSAYGWHFDQALLVLPIIAVAGRRASVLGRLPLNLVVAYTVLNCILMLIWPLPTIALLPAPFFLVLLLRKKEREMTAMVSVPAQ